MRFLWAWSLFGIAVLALAQPPVAVSAEDSRVGLPAVVAAASPSPSPSPNSLLGAPPAKKKRLTVNFASYTEYANNQMVGPGVNGAAEIANFSAGGALAPGTPYSFFSGAPLVTGSGTNVSLLFDPGYALSSALDLTAHLGYGTLSSDGNVAPYWGDTSFPTLNPFIGTRAITLTPAFTTHNGQDSVSATKGSVLGATLALHNGDGAFNVGWFDLHQTVPFVFSQIAGPNTPEQLVPQLPRSIGNGAPSDDVLVPLPAVLPLSGADFWLKTNLASIEVADADLPAPVGSPARIQSVSAIVDHGGGLAYLFEATHLQQWGPETERVLFGNSPTLTPGGEGSVPQSTIYGQQMGVVGAAATFPVPAIASDAEARIGYSCYSANGTYLTSNGCASGTYLFGRLHHGFAAFDLDLSIEKTDPQYAPAILNYGTILNVWTLPAAWPTPWLKNSYHLADTGEAGPNREGFRLASTTLLGAVEARFSYAQYTQVQPLDNATAYTPGFVDPYFLPQTSTAAGTRGSEQRFQAWFGWHPAAFNVQLQLEDVTTRRATPLTASQDNVSMNYPGAVLGFSRDFGPKLFGAWGVGRIAINGAFDSATANADLAENVIFAGLELRQNANSAYALQWQLYSVDGTATLPGGMSPAFHGPQIQVYQRFKT